MRKLLSMLLILILLCSAAGTAEEIILSDDFLLGVIPEPSDITPAYRSEHHPEGHENCYWCTPMNITDEERVWKMLTADITLWAVCFPLPAAING